MPLKRRMLAANERRRAKMPGLQRMRLASSAKLYRHAADVVRAILLCASGHGWLWHITGAGWQHDVADKQGGLAGIAP